MIFFDKNYNKLKNEKQGKLDNCNHKNFKVHNQPRQRLRVLHLEEDDEIQPVRQVQLLHRGDLFQLQPMPEGLRD